MLATRGIQGKKKSRPRQRSAGAGGWKGGFLLEYPAMSLPILTVRNEPSREDLVRFYHRAMLHWTRHLAEESPLDFGVAMHNAEMNRVHDANRMLDAIVPEGVGVEEVVNEANAFFAERQTHCWSWVINPSAPPERADPLADHLAALGYSRESTDILHLANAPARIDEVAGLTIIPARASFRHSRALAEEASMRWNEPQLVEASMLHLDDSHVDALVALKEGAAAGQCRVLAMGEIGLIEDVFVSAPFRRQGIGRTLLSRALEICARSLFRHVLIGVAPDNAAAQSLYKRVGFQKIGECIEHHRRE